MKKSQLLFRDSWHAQHARALLPSQHCPSFGACQRVSNIPASSSSRHALLSAVHILCRLGALFVSVKGGCKFAGHLSGESKEAAMLWLACHDTDAANAEAAQRLVEAASVGFPREFVRPLADQLPHDSVEIRQAAALALAHGMKARLPQVSSTDAYLHDHCRSSV